MKKILVSMFLLVFGLCLVGCASNIEIKEYQGKKLVQLEYTSIDYNGGYTSVYVFDFLNNIFKLKNYLPADQIQEEFKIFTEFTDAQETTLINKLYSYGFFNIKEEYKSPGGIIDGGGWNLEIFFEDGSSKLSKGSNNSPKQVFSNCAKAFYDICGDGIVGYVESDYYSPPKIDCSVTYLDNGTHYSFSSYYLKRVNYSWNGFVVESENAYSLSESIFDNMKKCNYELKFSDSVDYTFSLFTANYKMYGDYPRFKKCIVKSYQLNENLNYEKLIFEKKWFSQTEFKLEMNRLYVITLMFDNGDYVDYAFNTKLSE